MGTNDDEGIGMVSDAAAERRAKRARARARKAALPPNVENAASSESAGPSSELKAPEPVVVATPAEEGSGNVKAEADDPVAGTQSEVQAEAASSDTGEKPAAPAAAEEKAENGGAADEARKPAPAIAPIVLPDSRPGEPPRGPADSSAAPRIDPPIARSAPAGVPPARENARRAGGGILLASVAALAIVLGAGWYAYANGWIYTDAGETQTASAEMAQAEPETDNAAPPAADASPPTDAEDRSLDEESAEARRALEAELRQARDRLREAEARIAELERSESAAPAEEPSSANTEPESAEVESPPIRDVTPINRPEQDVESTSPDEPRSATAGAEEGAETASIDQSEPVEQAFPSEESPGEDGSTGTPEAAPLTPPALPAPRPPMLATTAESPSSAPIASDRPPQDDFAAAPRRMAGDPILRGWYLRGVYDGMALIDGPSGLIEVMPGDRLPGTGRIQSIRRVGGGWAVVTSRGIIPFQP